MQSIVTRLVIVTGGALLLFAAPIVLLLGAEGYWDDEDNSALISESNLDAEPILEQVEAEEPVIQVASLSIGSEKPSLEIVDFSGPLKTETNDYIDLALELSEQRKFEQALQTLDDVHLSNRDHYSVKFLEARILSWYGKHQEAAKEFEALRAQHPDNLDVMVSYGYLHFYQRNYHEAEQLFETVLDHSPDYHDARTGLERSRTVRKNR